MMRCWRIITGLHDIFKIRIKERVFHEKTHYSNPAVRSNGVFCRGRRGTENLRFIFSGGHRQRFSRHSDLGDAVFVFRVYFMGDHRRLYQGPS